MSGCRERALAMPQSEGPPPISLSIPPLSLSIPPALAPALSPALNPTRSHPCPLTRAQSHPPPHSRPLLARGGACRSTSGQRFGSRTARSASSTGASFAWPCRSMRCRAHRVYLRSHALPAPARSPPVPPSYPPTLLSPLSPSVRPTHPPFFHRFHRRPTHPPALLSSLSPPFCRPFPRPSSAALPSQ